MFNQLRLRLTLTNVVIVSLIFFIFMLGIFLIMRKITDNQTEQLIKLISVNAGLKGTSMNLKDREHDEQQYRYFYVKLNNAGVITSATPSLDVKNKRFREIVTRAFIFIQTRWHD